MPFVVKVFGGGLRAVPCPSWVGKRIVMKVYCSEFGDFFYAWGVVVREVVVLGLYRVELTLEGGPLVGAQSYYDSFEENCRELAPDERSPLTVFNVDASAGKETLGPKEFAKAVIAKAEEIAALPRDVRMRCFPLEVDGTAFDSYFALRNSAADLESELSPPPPES